MEEEKPRPVDLLEEALLIRDGAAAAIRGAAADVVAEASADDVHMQQEPVAAEEAHRRDLTAGGEAVAHALHVAELQALESETGLPGGRRSLPAAQERRAGAHQDLIAYLETSPSDWITFPGDGAASTSRSATTSPIRGIAHPFARFVADLTAATQRHPARVVRRPIYFEAAGLVSPVRISAPPPMIVHVPAAADVPASPETGSFASGASASSSRSVQDGELNTAATLPGKTPPAGDTPSASCAAQRAPALARIVAADEVFSEKRWSLLAEPVAQTVFSGMEDVPDNDWYESIADDEQMEELELLDVLDDASSQRLPPRSETPRAAVADAGKEHHDLLKADAKMKEKMEEDPGVDGTASDEEGGGALAVAKLLARPCDDEAGPSTKRRPRVRPLDDDDVPKFDCGICLEALPVFDVFHGMPCEHRFCLACMVEYVEGRINEGAVPISCPYPACRDGGGGGELHPERCKKTIDFAAFSNWGLRLVELAVPPGQRAYCPNRRCGIMLITSGEEKPAMAACPACGHRLCATCGMEWGADDGGEHDCAKGPEAALVWKLAVDLRWKQCPRCKMMVERISGCRVMSCRCHCVFCYQCGKSMGPGHQGCQCDDMVHAFMHADFRNLHN